MSSSNRRDLERFLRKLGREGKYRVTRGRRSGHYKVKDAQGRVVASASSTPSDSRALRNFKGDLRRAEAGQ